MTISLSTLFTAATAEEVLALGLQVARSVGLSVSSWRVGDPTRASFKFLAEALGAPDGLEAFAALFARSAFLSTSEDDWKTLVAQEVYGVERPAASYATSTVTLENTGGGWYDIEAGDFTVSASGSGVTYHTTEAFELHGEGDTTVTVEADVAGSAGSAGVNEIDTVVTALLGVTVTGSTLAVASDAGSDAELDTLCAVSLGPLSPNGPPEAYDAVALNEELTGTDEVTKSQTSEDSATGDVTVWLGGATGPPSGAAVTAVQAAIDLWSAPLCITPTAAAATADVTACTATIDGDDLPSGAVALCEAAYGVVLAATAIGGRLARSAIISAMQVALTEAGATNVSVTLTVPSADVELADGHMATAGAVTITEA